jgi:hypothetical protein
MTLPLGRLPVVKVSSQKEGARESRNFSVIPFSAQVIFGHFRGFVPDNDSLHLLVSDHIRIRFTWTMSSSNRASFDRQAKWAMETGSIDCKCLRPPPPTDLITARTRQSGFGGDRGETCIVTGCPSEPGPWSRHPTKSAVDHVQLEHKAMN